MSANHFTLLRSQNHQIPIVVSVPHAGLEIPKQRAELSTLPKQTLLRDADYEVHQFWQSSCEMLDITFIKSNIHRYVIDLNRSAKLNDDYVENHSLKGRGETKGLFWTQSTHGENLGADGTAFKKLSSTLAHEIIELYWQPYYQTLKTELDLLKNRHGKVLLIDAHSMPSSATSAHADLAGSLRADIVPGNLNGKSCLPTHLDTTVRVAQDLGYSINPNSPYSGGNITKHFSKVELHEYALQIEVNRELYMNETTKELDQVGIERLQKFTLALLQELSRA